MCVSCAGIVIGVVTYIGRNVTVNTVKASLLQRISQLLCHHEEILDRTKCQTLRVICIKCGKLSKGISLSEELKYETTNHPPERLYFDFTK